MMELYDLIDAIEKRPAMYLGQPSITQLGSFLSGYFFARRQLGIPETIQEQRFSQFQVWMQQRFNTGSDQSWDKMILYSCPDEKSALNQFFVLFKEFLNSDQTASISPIQSPLAS